MNWPSGVLAPLAYRSSERLPAPGVVMETSEVVDFLESDTMNEHHDMDLTWH